MTVLPFFVYMSSNGTGQSDRFHVAAQPYTPRKHLWMPLKCKIFENIMKNGTFALEEEQMFHFP